MTRDELEQKIRLQSGLLQISLAVQKMAQPDDLAQVMQVCLAEANKMGLKAVSMALHRMLDPDQNLVETFRVGPDGPITTAERRTARGMGNRWRSGLSFIKKDRERKRLQGHFGGLPIRCYIDVPFASGVISAHSLQPYAFSSADEEILKQIAEIFAAGISRMYDLEKMAEKGRLESGYRDIAQTILSSLSLEDVLDHLGIHIIQASIFRSLAISLVDHKAQLIEIKRSFNKLRDGTISKLPSREVGNVYPLASSDPTAEAAHSGQLVIIEGYDERFGKNSPPDYYDGQVFYFFPVKNRDEVIAVLATGSLTEEKAETLKKIETLQPLLDLVVIAIENARLYEFAQQEIEDRIRAEKALEISEKLHRGAIEAAGAVPFSKWEGGLEMGEGIEGLTGYTAAEFDLALWRKITQETVPLGHLKHLAADEVWPQLQAGEEDAWLLEHLIQTRDGQNKWLLSVGKIMYDDQGVPVRALGMLQDITERKLLEQELITLQRLRAASELSAGVSHNLNNMLVGILGPAQLLKTKTDDVDILEDADDILRAATRAKELVQRLHLSTRRVRPSRPESVDLEEIITQAVQQSRLKWKDEAEAMGIAIAVDTHLTGVSAIQATQSEMHDMMINLIFNAVDAMPEGGQITIETQEINNEVVLSFSDTGVGMDAETKGRIFEPFFTTKSDVGSGLGLSTVYNSVRNWDGRIGVESLVGTGTIFDIRFPLIQMPDTEQATDDAQILLSGKVLVVEDDDMVRSVLQRMLIRHYDVDLQADGEGVFNAFTTGAYQVALIDLGLPNMSGDQVAKRIRNKDPNIALVLVTGWGIETFGQYRSAFDFFIQKPFDNPVALYEVIDRAIRLYHTRCNENGSAKVDS